MPILFILKLCNVKLEYTIIITLKKKKRFAKCSIDYWMALFFRRNRYACACLFNLTQHTVDFLTGLMRGHILQ